MVAQYVILFAYYVAIARLLTQEDVGQISLLSLTMTVFSLLTTLAIPSAATKYIADSLGRGSHLQASAAARASLRIVVTISAPALVVALAVSPFIAGHLLGTGSAPEPLMLALGAALTGNLSGLLYAQLIGLGAFALAALQSVLGVLTARLSAVMMAYTGLGVGGVAGGWLVGGLVGLLGAAIALRGKLTRTRETFPVRRLLTYSGPIFLANIIGTVQGWADLAILYSLTADLAAAGVYYLIVNSITVFAILYSPISTAVFSSVAFDYDRRDHASVNWKIQETTRMVATLVIPTSFALAAVSRTAITVAYGRPYLAGTAPFVLLALTVIAPALSALYGGVLQGLGETKAIAKTGALAAGVQLSASIILIPGMGVIGAAIARVLMSGSMLALYYHVLKKTTALRVQTGYIPRLILATTVIAIPLAVIDWQFVQLATVEKLILETACFVVLAVLANRALRVVKLEDIDQIAAVLPSVLRGPLRAFGRVLVSRRDA
jgi:O-antigen/teichoic acid export membrane protein